MGKHKTHPLEWVSLGCAVAALSYTEWSLAVAAGAHPIVAAAVPGALDVYAIRAMRTRRHVPVVVFAMVSVNAVSYLVHAGAIPVNVPVLVLVSSIAPLTFWAVHALGHAEKHAQAHVPETSSTLDAHTEHGPSARTADDFGWRTTVPSGDKEWSTFDAHVSTVPGVRDMRTGEGRSTAPERERTRELSPPVLREHAYRRGTPGPLEGTPVLPVLEDPEYTPEHEEACAVLTLPLPTGFGHGEHSDTDRALAEEHTPWFLEHTQEHGRVPSLRTVKAQCRVSTDRARALLQIWNEGEHSGSPSPDSD